MTYCPAKIPTKSFFAIPWNHQTKGFLHIRNLYRFHQLIQSPTRITAGTATTIDLFITILLVNFYTLVSRISTLVIIHLFAPLANYAFQVAPLRLFLADNLKISSPLVLGGI